MSKSSKRRRARAAKFNNPQRAIGILVAESPGRPDVPLLSSSPSEISNLKSPSTPVSSPSALSTPNSVLLTPVKSLLQAAAQTAASPQRATDIPVGVPLPCSSALNSELSTFNSPSVPSSSELSNLKSDLASSSPPSAPSTQNSALLSPTSPLCHSARSSPASGGPLPPSAPSTQNSALLSATSSLRHSAPSSLPSDPPSPFFTEFLEPFCPPQQLDFIELPPIPPDPNHPSAINCQLHDYQAKLKPIFANLSPDDPNVERINHNYVIVMQIATVERLIASLPGLSEKAMVETNNQIVRMLSIIERTNSRKSRELREKDAAARRIIREQQRKDRQAQKEAESIARNQRTQQREEQRRQRELANAQRAQQKHELAMKKLDLKERTLIAREEQKQETLDHRNSGKSKESPTPVKPVGPPNSWTCG